MESVKVADGKLDNLTLEVAIEMPFNIKAIESTSHAIKMKVLVLPMTWFTWICHLNTTV